MSDNEKEMDVNIRDWTFTHWWVRPVVKTWFDIYHKSVTYSGTENIDWQKPIIFAPSHQNAFSDALCLILPTKYTNDRFIYPLIRADAFGNNSITDWILTAFHMLPVYRPRDKVDLKQQNESVFAHCYEILGKNRNLLIHAEGNCIAKKKVRRFKKGLARIALGAEQEYNFELGVQVLPIGINYRSITEARKGIHIRCGRPILISDFKDLYKDHPARAISELTQEAEKEVRKVTVDIQADNYEFAEQFIHLNKSITSNFSDDSRYTKSEVEFEKKLAETLAEAERTQPDFTESCKKYIRELTAIINKNKLYSDYLLVKQASASRLFWEGLVYLILSPIFVYGWINNITPWFLIHKMAESVEEKQFKSSLRMLSGLLVFPICYTIQAVFFGWISASISWSFVYLLSLPFAGIISLNIYENWKGWRQQLQLKCMPEGEKMKLSGLIEDMLREF